MNDIRHRSNLRGLVKCKECNHYNGTRALSCKNKQCSLSRVIAQRKPKQKIDAVQLITQNESRIFSVRVRDDQRNFVSITDKVISSDESGALISRNAICFIDTCKYDSTDVNISCKHVKCALEETNEVANALTIDLNVLNALKVSTDAINSFWTAFTEAEPDVPLVQQINDVTFVVKCEISRIFPAGLLHVSFGNESPRCACKKMKISLTPNNSVVMESDECDHLLLVYAAIMSNERLQNSLASHLAQIESAFDMTKLNANEVDEPVIDFQNLTSSIEANLFGDSISATVDSLSNVELIHVPSALNSSSTIVDHEKDENTGNDNNLQRMNFDNIHIINDDTIGDDNLEALELIDCHVELMDQFKLAECANEIYCDENQVNYFDSSTVCDMTLGDWCNVQDDMIFDQQNDIVMTENPVDEIVSIESDTSHRAKYSKKVTVLTTDEWSDGECGDKTSAPLNNLEMKFYVNWLDSVIERINMTMNYADNGRPDPLTFSVPNTFFEILRKKFSAGTKKKRLPNRTILLADGKLKGLSLFGWHFANLKLIKHIFTTSNMSLEIIRTFRKVTNDEFVRDDEIKTLVNDETYSGCYKKILPTMYKTFLKTKHIDSSQKTATTDRYGLFVVEWIPNVLPKSQYGEMRVIFQFGHMKNNKIVVRK